MRWVAGSVLLLGFSACQQDASITENIVVKSALPEDGLLSAYEYLTDDSKSLQDDEFENPGYLWVDRGAAIFADGANANGQSCAACHMPEEMIGVAARYPIIEEEIGRVINLEGRINQCRIEHQGETAFAYESDELLALTAFISEKSKGQPKLVELSSAGQFAFERGEAYFFTRRGQLNLACSQCHNENWGKMLRGDRISQGHGNAFPGYRFEWQTLGSLHRRFVDCDDGVRAEPRVMGSEDYLALEYYLAIRSNGLPLESPGVRR